MINTPEGDKYLADLRAAKDYRRFVGPRYQETSYHQFVILVTMGLHEDCSLLDVGCGSLAGGKLFIPFLKRDMYYGIEPTDWVLNGALDEFEGLIADRRAHFNTNDCFEVDVFEDRKQFEFILLHSVFTHAPLWMIDKAVGNIQKGMHNDSRLVGTYFLGATKNEYKGDEWIYPKGVFYTQDTMHSVFKKHGLKFTTMPVLHPEGQVWFVATKGGF